MKNLQEIINYKFKNIKYLEQVLIHSSYSNEHRTEGLQDNEKLEFLGDAALELSVSSYIFHEYPSLLEGDLTKLRASVVCEAMLAKIARKIGLGKYMKIGKGEENTGGREKDSVLSDAFEALIGAVYLDGGFDVTKKFVISFLEDEIRNLSTDAGYHDSKTYLQEHLQKNKNVSIKYSVIEEKGPAHNRRFVVQVENNGKLLGTGKGKSKKEAEQDAAHNALKTLGL